MPPSAHPDTRFTYEDFLRFPDDGKRHEIIDGEHYVTAAPTIRHQRVSQRLFLDLGNHLRAHPHQGEAFYAPVDVVLSFHDVVEPDLLVVTGDQSDVLTDKNVQGAPALVVEVLSPSTRKRDEQIKRRAYERLGVREYWVVDPELDLIKVFRRSGERLPRVAELSAEEHDTLETPLLPGFAIRLERLFV